MDGSRSSDDRAFQAAGPDVENARGPNVDVSVLGTTNWLSSADRSRDRPKTEEVGTQSLVRYTALALADTCRHIRKRSESIFKNVKNVKAL